LLNECRPCLCTHHLPSWGLEPEGAPRDEETRHLRMSSRGTRPRPRTLRDLRDSDSANERAPSTRTRSQPVMSRRRNFSSVVDEAREAQPVSLTCKALSLSSSSSENAGEDASSLTQSSPMSGATNAEFLEVGRALAVCECLEQTGAHVMAAQV